MLPSGRPRLFWREHLMLNLTERKTEGENITSEIDESFLRKKGVSVVVQIWYSACCVFSSKIVVTIYTKQRANHKNRAR